MEESFLFLNFKVLRNLTYFLFSIQREFYMVFMKIGKEKDWIDFQIF